MVRRVRQQFVEEGLNAVLSRKRGATPAVTPVFDEKEARLMALACSAPPEGHARWTLRLLEDKVVELGIVSAQATTLSAAFLKKRTLAPPQKQWVILPEANGAFVAAMEEVLDVYTQPHEPEMPLVSENR